MDEKSLLKEVIELCRYYKLLYFHSYDARQDKMPGFVDLVIVGADVLFAELKSDYGLLTSEQITWRYALQVAGAKHVVWKPQDLESKEIEHQLSLLRIPLLRR